MEFETTTQSKSSSGKPGSYLEPTDSDDMSQLIIGSNEYNRYLSPVDIFGD